jgi:hypothetical protein
MYFSSVELVWTQILQGIGGGIASSAAQVGAQASVTHNDVAITTALVLLLTEIGGSVGGAIGANHSFCSCLHSDVFFSRSYMVQHDGSSTRDPPPLPECLRTLQDLRKHLYRSSAAIQQPDTARCHNRYRPLCATTSVSPTDAFSAYSEVMKLMLITATCLSIITPLAALMMPNYYLGDQQNAVDQAGLTGERMIDREIESES